MEGKSNGAGKICLLTREEAVRQLSDLRDHCRSMISGDNDYPEWALDVEALDMAIAALLPVSREKMERYGDTRVVSVTGEMPEQMQIWRK